MCIQVSYLPPTTSEAGFPVLMAHDQDSYAAFKIAIYDRVWKNFQRECSSPSCRWRSEIGKFNQELGDSFKFFKKAFSNHKSSLFSVKIQRVGNIMLRSGVERVGHRVSLARSRAIASCPETAEIEPDSSSVSLRSASRSQASSTSGSESRLAIMSEQISRESSSNTCSTIPYGGPLNNAGSLDINRRSIRFVGSLGSRSELTISCASSEMATIMREPTSVQRQCFPLHQNSRPM